MNTDISARDLPAENGQAPAIAAAAAGTSEGTGTAEPTELMPALVVRMMSGVEHFQVLAMSSDTPEERLKTAQNYWNNVIINPQLNYFLIGDLVLRCSMVEAITVRNVSLPSKIAQEIRAQALSQTAGARTLQ